MTAPILTGLEDNLRLLVGPPPLADYLGLRAESGLSPKTVEQGQAGPTGSWAGVRVVQPDTGEVVGMGRVIADGGWYSSVSMPMQVEVANLVAQLITSKIADIP